jgi:hypothetical protein
MVVAIALVSGLVHAAGGSVPGEKLDSGLGALPSYSEWKKHPDLARYVAVAERTTQATSRVPGEKLDSGLGALPPYSRWKDDPELARLVARDGAKVVSAEAFLGSR